MANPWDNDPIVTPAPKSAESWKSAPIVTAPAPKPEPAYDPMGNPTGAMIPDSDMATAKAGAGKPYAGTLAERFLWELPVSAVAGSLGMLRDLHDTNKDLVEKLPYGDLLAPALSALDPSARLAKYLPGSKTIEDAVLGKAEPGSGKEWFRTTGELIAPVPGKGMIEGGKAVLGGVKKGYGYLKGVEELSRGEAVLKDAEELRDVVKTQAAGKASSIKTEAAEAAAQKAKHEAELTEIEKVHHQIAERKHLRARTNRNIRQAGDPTAAISLRQDATAEMRGRVRDAERAAREAGLTAEEARVHAVEQERKIVDAETAAQSIEEDHLALPTTDPVEFGKKIQTAAEAIENKYVAAREEGAKFGEAIAKDGDKIVRTNAVDAYIKEAAKDTANPELVSAFKFIDRNIKKELEGGAVAKGMNLRKANSLRKQLDSIISSKQLKLENGVAVGLDTETLHHIRQVRRLLNKAAFQTSKDYEQALINFRKLSRPLDQFQRKGALKDIVAKDSLSDDFIKARADVVGAVLRREKAGKSIFSELVKHDPTLVDSAKMYFHNELFGSADAKKVPSIATLRNFLDKNDRVLTELGIYDDFADLKSARESGQAAIERARGGFEAAKAEAKSAEQLAQEAVHKVEAASRLRKLAVERQKKAMAGVKSRDDIAQAASEKAESAALKLENRAKETESKILDLSAKKAAAEDKALSYRGDINEIGAGDARTSMSQARSLARKLLDDHVIDVAQHGALVEKIADINAKFKEKDEAARHIKNSLMYVVGSIGAAGLAKFGINHIRRMVF